MLFFLIFCSAYFSSSADQQLNVTGYACVCVNQFSTPCSKQIQNHSITVVQSPQQDNFQTQATLTEKKGISNWVQRWLQNQNKKHMCDFVFKNHHPQNMIKLHICSPISLTMQSRWSCFEDSQWNENWSLNQTIYNRYSRKKDTHWSELAKHAYNQIKVISLKYEPYNFSVIKCIIKTLFITKISENS